MFNLQNETQYVIPVDEGWMYQNHISVEVMLPLASIISNTNTWVLIKFLDLEAEPSLQAEHV